MAHVSANVVQTDYRLRENSGNEATPTWIEALNTTATIDVDTPFRIRVAIAETAGGSANNENFLLRYLLNGSGGYQTVTASTAVQFAAFNGANDGDATTQQISSGTFVAGELDNNGVVNNISLSSSGTEMEFCITLDSAQISDGDVLDFRVYSNGAVLDSYTNTGRVTARVQTQTETASGSLQAGSAGISGSAVVSSLLAGTFLASVSGVSGAGVIESLFTGNLSPGAAIVEGSTTDGTVTERTIQLGPGQPLVLGSSYPTFSDFWNDIGVTLPTDLAAAGEWWRIQCHTDGSNYIDITAGAEFDTQAGMTGDTVNGSLILFEPALGNGWQHLRPVQNHPYTYHGPAGGATFRMTSFSKIGLGQSSITTGLILRFEGLQVDIQDDGSIFTRANTNGYVTFSNCILWNASTTRTGYLSATDTINLGPVAYETDNNLSFSASSVHHLRIIGYGIGYSMSCNIGVYMGSAVTPATEAFIESNFTSDQSIANNNIALNFDFGLQIAGGSAPILNAWLTDGTSANNPDLVGGTNTQFQIDPTQYFTAFVYGSTTASDYDFRPLNNANLVGKGVRETGQIITDAMGNVRADPFDIGPLNYQSSSALVTGGLQAGNADFLGIIASQAPAPFPWYEDFSNPDSGYDGVNYANGTYFTNPRSFTWREDGLFFIVNDQTQLASFTCTVPFKQDTATPSKTFDISSISSEISCHVVSPDGTKIWLTSYAGNIPLREINMSTAWDLDTASINTTDSFAYETETDTIDATGLWVDPTAQFMLIIGFNEVISRVDMGNGWDITALSFTTGQSIAVGSLGNTATGVAADPNGGTIYCINVTSDRIHKITLNNGEWDFSGGWTDTGESILVSSQMGNPEDVTFDPLGRFAFVIGGSGNATIWRYLVAGKLFGGLQPGNASTDGDIVLLSGDTVSGNLVAIASLLSGTSITSNSLIGALSADPSTADGTANVSVTASGSLISGNSLIDGEIESLVTISGSLEALQAVAQGTATVSANANGDFVASISTASGTIKSSNTAGGNLEVSISEIDGSATVGIEASGSIIAGVATTDGESLVKIEMSGALLSANAEIDGVGAVTINLSGNMLSLPSVLSGAADVSSFASGAIDGGIAQMNASANVSVFTSGALVPAQAQVDGLITVQGVIVANGVLTAQNAQVDGSGVVASEMSGLLISGPAASDGDMISSNELNGSLEPEPSTVEGFAGAGTFMVGNLVAESSSVSGSATVSSQVIGLLTSEAATVSGDVDVINALAGDLQADPSAVFGTTGASIEASGSLQALTAVIDGEAVSSVTASGNLAPFNATVSGEAVPIVTMSGGLVSGISEISGEIDVQAVIFVSGDLVSADAEITGQIESIITANGVLQSLSSVADGEVVVVISPPSGGYLLKADAQNNILSTDNQGSTLVVDGENSVLEVDSEGNVLEVDAQNNIIWILK